MYEHSAVYLYGHCTQCPYMLYHLTSNFQFHAVVGEVLVEG